MSTRIGILTGGGDCPGLNGVIRAATLHARQTYGWEVVGICNGFEGLYDEEYVDLTSHGEECGGRNGRTGLLLSAWSSSTRRGPGPTWSRCADGRRADEG